MFLTQTLLKKAKAKEIMVLLSSRVSGHRRWTIRPRVGDKVEDLFYDPIIQQDAPYREVRKIRSMGKKS